MSSDLFDPPAPKPPKVGDLKKRLRELNDQRLRKGVGNVESWAEDELLHVAMNHPELTEQDVCLIDGSGPPTNWRDRLNRVEPQLTHLAPMAAVKMCIRLGLLPRSIFETIPREILDLDRENKAIRQRIRDLRAERRARRKPRGSTP